jgi:2-dehydro-3-deoxygluconokinase
MDVVCLGEPMLEFNQQANGTYLQGFGGDTSNAAVSAARQGAKVGYLTRLGTDRFGDAFMDLWHAAGIDTSQVIRDPDYPTAIYFVTHDQDGHHFSYRRADSAATRMRPGDFSADYIASAKILHVSGISQAISVSAADTVFDAIEIARTNDTRVAYDTNLRLGLWPTQRARAVIHEAIRSCQIALPSYDDATVLTGLQAPQDIVDFYLHLGADLVVLKLGAKGCVVGTPRGRTAIEGVKASSVDANAAGDTFAGALLAEIAAGREPPDAARWANLAAALSTQRQGAVSSIPGRDEVAQFASQKISC